MAGSWRVSHWRREQLGDEHPYPVGVPRRFFRLALDVAAGVPEGFSLIPAGAFTMGRTSGDNDINAPPVTVTVSAFFMGKHEVTKALWDDVRTWGAANGYTDLRVGAARQAITRCRRSVGLTR